MLICSVGFTGFSSGGKARWATRRGLKWCKNIISVVVFLKTVWWFYGVFVRGAKIRFLYAEELEPLGPVDLESFGLLFILDLNVVLVICMLLWSCT